MRTYKWNLRDGREVVLEAEYSEEVVSTTIWADGDIIPNEKEIRDHAMLTAYIDGKRWDSCRFASFWSVIDCRAEGMKKIWGIKGIAFTQDRAKEINAFLQGVIADGRCPEAEEIRAKKEAEWMAKEIEEARRTITKAEMQLDIPDKKEARRRMYEYNQLMNDGGDGYVPYIVSREEYEAAKALVAEANS